MGGSAAKKINKVSLKYVASGKLPAKYYELIFLRIGGALAFRGKNKIRKPGRRTRDAALINKTVCGAQ